MGAVLLVPGVTGVGPLAAPMVGGTYWRGWKSALKNQGFNTVLKVSQPPGAGLEACVTAALPTLLNNASPTNRAHLIGHSRGGLIVRRMATLHPTLVRSVTCVATPHRGQLLMDLYEDLAVYCHAMNFVLPGNGNMSPNDPLLVLTHAMSQGLLASTVVDALVQFNQDNHDQKHIAYANVIGVLDHRPPSLALVGSAALLELAEPGTTGLPADVQKVVDHWRATQLMAYKAAPDDILYGNLNQQRGHDGAVVAECARTISPGHIELLTHLDHSEQVGLALLADSGGLARRVALNVLKPAEQSLTFPP